MNFVHNQHVRGKTQNKYVVKHIYGRQPIFISTVAT